MKREERRSLPHVGRMMSNEKKSQNTMGVISFPRMGFLTGVFPHASPYHAMHKCSQVEYT